MNQMAVRRQSNTAYFTRMSCSRTRASRIPRRYKGLPLCAAFVDFRLIFTSPLRRVPTADRGRKGFRLPSLRTVRAVLPHTALQSLVSSSGVPRAFVSCFEGEQPAIREKDIWPAAVVLESATAAGTLRLLAQD